MIQFSGFIEKPIRNILIPINFSDSASKAIQVAIAMCKRHNASLHLLKVNEVNPFPFPSGKKALLIGIRLESKVAELESMECQAKQIESAHNIRCFFHVAEGAFYNTVAEIADDFYCDLIVVEKRSGLMQFGFSLNRDIYAIIQTSSCPVMSVPGNCNHEQFKSILFPVWVRRSVMSKLQVALPIIEKNAAKVVVFGSVKSPNDIWERRMVNMLMGSVRALLSLSTKDIEKEVQDTPGTAKSILRKAVECKSELIIISASVAGGFLSFFKPSYTRFIINHSTVPVLTVK